MQSGIKLSDLIALFLQGGIEEDRTKDSGMGSLEVSAHSSVTSKVNLPNRFGLHSQLQIRFTVLPQEERQPR